MLQSLIGGARERDPVDSSAPRGRLVRDDAYDPRSAHEQLLERVRGEARAEAIRHAEAIVDRDLPIVGEAGAIGAQRVAALGAAYAAAKGRLDATAMSLENDVRAAESQLETTERALRREVDEGEVGLRPLGDRAVSLWQVAGSLAVGAFAGVAVGRLDLGTTGVALVVALALAAVLGLLSLRIDRPESARLTALRRNRDREKSDVDELRSELEKVRAQIKSLVEETLRLVEVESAFAKQLVTAYEQTLASSLPVGALGEGERTVRKQREPRFEVPDWVQELEQWP